MQPTPPEPANRANCCDCNARELEEAKIRQERSNRDDQYRTTINAAVVIAEHTLGEATDEARQFLAELFRQEYNEITLPRF
jgi:F0F1-type ATP synthase membrane subunit b/b'